MKTHDLKIVLRLSFFRNMFCSCIFLEVSVLVTRLLHFLILAYKYDHLKALLTHENIENFYFEHRFDIYLNHALALEIK